jgi:hypothetical protein
MTIPTIERRATSLRRGKPTPLNAARRAYAAASRHRDDLSAAIELIGTRDEPAERRSGSP